MADVDIHWIVRQMIGSDAKDFVKRRAITRSAGRRSAPKTSALPRMTGGYAVDHVSLSVRAGEILGVYGLMGAGRSEFFECVMGRHPQRPAAYSSTGKPVARARRERAHRAAGSR